ncbi:major capsid protein [Escherichia coli]|nr:major capsid protein [Escherichia coli]
MSNLREYQNRIADIAKRSKAVLGWASTAQFGTDNQFIKDDAARAASILEAARKDPVFAGISDNATAQIATAWASALADYAAAHKSMPRPEILASCHQTLENCLIESTRNSMDATNKAMLESVAAEMMSVSDGVMRLPLFLAMILPVQLGAATADACTFIPVTRDQSDIYEVFNVAGSSFGSYAAVCTASYAAAMCWWQAPMAPAKPQPSRWKTSKARMYQSEKVVLTSTLTVLSLLLITVPAAYFTRLLMLLVSKSLLPAL